MYPSPSTVYRPQVLQQPSQLIPQTTNQNIHPSSPPLPPPPTSSSSAYPYTQYNQNSNAVASGHSGQQPFSPHAVPFGMATNVTGPTNHQNNNNLNNPQSVSIMKINKF
jgi:hypothetical protein